MIFSESCRKDFNEISNAVFCESFNHSLSALRSRPGIVTFRGEKGCLSCSGLV